MPGWRFFGFVDPVAEHNYVQQYCASRFWGRVAATVVLMLAQLGPVVFSKLAAPAGIAAQSCHVGNFWTAVVGVPSMLLLAAAVGSSYFVNSWGHVYISCQVLVATGLGFAVRPPCCAWCAFVWQRRVLVASAVGIISPVLTHHYILGGIISWLAASLVDYADPQAACGQSWVCVAGAVQQLIAACARGGPTTLTYYVLQALASHASRGHLADWLVPGLLVCYREGRSRTAWLAQQQQQQPLEQQPSSSQAAESSSFMTAVTAGAAGARHVHWAEGSLTTSEAQAEALTRPGLGAPAGAAAAAAAALLPAAAPPLAAAHGSVSPRVQQLILARMAAGLPLYVSPARSKLVSIKLNSPEGAGQPSNPCLLIRLLGQLYVLQYAAAQQQS
jgi:hypothetical protein